jgi:4-amino-4-deoxy-L-arabinose transferase-like glycosyltransferase
MPSTRPAPSASFLSNRTLAWLGLILVFGALGFRLGCLPLLAPDEGRNAEVGREMKESGAWLVPTYNGLDYLDKPAFYFKTVALSLVAFGNNETAARLPSALFGGALVLLTFGFARKIHGTRGGLLAAIIVATTPLYAANSRTVIFDIALAFFVCGAIFAGYLAEAADGKTRRNWYLLGAASAGCATLVKGPVGFLIPMLVLLVFHRVENMRGAWKRLLSPLNLLAFFAITLPWFVGLCLVHRDFFHYGVIEESFHRFTSAKAFHRHEPFYFYFFIIVATFFPWSLLLPEAGLTTWKQRWAKHPADRLCVVWSVVVVIFFSISQSKLPGYILSVAVSSGILTARLFDTAFTNPSGRPAQMVERVTLVFAVLCVLVSVGMLIGAPHAGGLAHPLRIPVADAEQLGHAAVPLGILLAGLGIFGFAVVYRRLISLCFLCLALFFPLFGGLGMGALNVIFDAKSGRAVARALPDLPAGTELACLNCYPNGVPFYLGRTTILISKDGNELTSNYVIYALKNETDWPAQIVPLANFDNWLAAQKKPVYLIVRKSDTNTLETLAAARGATVQTLPSGYWGAQLPAPGGS